jgi:intracellular sulfur oxidation DsrE/DsrF family protein
MTSKTVRFNHSKQPRLLSLFVLLVALCLATTLAPVFAHSEEDGVVRVVYHADFSDPRRFSAMLTSINNMLTHYNNELIEHDVRIVFVAHGIRFVTDDALAKTPFAADAELNERRENLKGRLLSLHEVHDVKLELCDITRSETGLAMEKLYEAVDSTPSGVVRIAELQRKGYAYIKIE